VVAARAVELGHEVVGSRATQAIPDSRVSERVLDVTDRYAVRRVLDEVSPEVVVHTAYRQDAWAVTAVGAANVALAASGCGARLVHVSSDVVFSGAAVTYAEDAVPEPVSPYGAAKAAAEVAVSAIAREAVIARTSLIMGRPEAPMERRVHELLEGRAAGKLFEDDIRCPVHVDDLASALVELAFSDASGVRHLAGPDAVSRLEIGRLIAVRDGVDPVVLQAGSRRAAGVPGPLDVRLDSRWSQGQLATRLRGAREFLADPAALR
jgi:dTDP-4-dehydrorhamnose reductase